MKYKIETLTTNKLLAFEEKLWSTGFKHVAGVDESGRGPLAGPVVAAAVIFPHNVYIAGVDDSKKLSPSKRDYLVQIIQKKSLAVGIGIVDEKEIDEINILQATFRAMNSAIFDLDIEPQHILVDGRENPHFNHNQTAIIGGDGLSFSIAAASIIAKVTRDRMMIEYDKTFPEFGFARHKGYPTRQHIDAIKRYGLCPIHRRSFRVKSING